jgi:hypothetical protein
MDSFEGLRVVSRLSEQLIVEGKNTNHISPQSNYDQIVD